MTMQMMDNFIFRGQRAKAIAVSRRFTFTPANDFGISTEAWDTGNYRGFWCDNVIDNLFIVKNLYFFSKSRNYPTINGKNPGEIPEFIKMLEKLNDKGKNKIRYIDGFPMQYKNIDYVYEYTGKILMGIEPVMNQSGQGRYKKVYELDFQNGLLDNQTDVTELWKSVCEKESDGLDRCWWKSESADYFYLINYAFMGMDASMIR